jgi:hypothetical protein
MPEQNTVTEPFTQQIGSSTVTLTEEDLTITVPRAFWTEKQWNWLFNTLFPIGCE